MGESAAIPHCPGAAISSLAPALWPHRASSPSDAPTVASRTQDDIFEFAFAVRGPSDTEFEVRVGGALARAGRGGSGKRQAVALLPAHVRIGALVHMMAHNQQRDGRTAREQQQHTSTSSKLQAKPTCRSCVTGGAATLRNADSPPHPPAPTHLHPITTPSQGGVYHGRILLPAEYPFKPPSFMMLTPSGRFQTNVKICLSISSHHPEHWQPSWSVRTALTALIAFMPSPGAGALGSLVRCALVSGCRGGWGWC
jgi:ubiquitin-protein ligase